MAAPPWLLLGVLPAGDRLGREAAEAAEGAREEGDRP